MGSPGAFFEFSKNNALSTDGQCKPYSDDADGTLWGEGAGVVVLERESRARRLGHRIYGRLLASRVNHNGGGGPIAVPSTEAQRRLIRKTVEAAGISPELVGMIEGTAPRPRSAIPWNWPRCRTCTAAARRDWGR